MTSRFMIYLGNLLCFVSVSREKVETEFDGASKIERINDLFYASTKQIKKREFE